MTVPPEPGSSPATSRTEMSAGVHAHAEPDPAVDTDPDDDLFEDDDGVEQPRRTGRFTRVLVLLIVAVLGVVLGLFVQKTFGGSATGAATAQAGPAAAGSGSAGAHQPAGPRPEAHCPAVP
jgi:hypothetical protein